MSNRLKGLIVIALLASLMAGCESRTDKKLNSLYQEATDYLEAGELENAIAVFDDMLEIKDDPEIKEKLDRTLNVRVERELSELDEQADTSMKAGDFGAAEAAIMQMLDLKDTPETKQKLLELKRDREALILIDNLFEEWKNIKEKIALATSGVTIMKLLEPTEPLIGDLEDVDRNGDSEAVVFIRNLIGNPLYQLYKTDYMTGKTIVTDYENGVTISTKKFRVSAVMDGLLELQPPTPPLG